MTIQPYEAPTIERIETPQDVAIHRLGVWARSASAAHSIAETLVQTSFCPETFKGKAGEATAAILAGLEVGLQPMAALRSFDVIQGQAAPRAATLRAIVQSQGHELELVESTSTRCKMRGRRKGASNWQEVTWTMDRATQLGVTNKSNWRNQPQAMLVARATSEIARLVASDAILGIGYSIEEIADGGATDEVPPEVAAPTTTGTRKMSRRKADEPEPPPEEEPQESPILDVKSDLAKAMYATIHDAGIPEEERIEQVGQIIGRPIESTKEMTEAEARQVLDHLNGMLSGASA